MSSRMSAFDASFLFMETPTTPMHSGGVAIFSPPADGFDHERLVRLIAQRLPYVPRYRQRVRPVPFGITRPVWVDDEHFDVTYHVRRSALPRPGSIEQLQELVARIMSRPLDRNRPLWEMYLVEGLADGNFAIITKSHEALIDGLSAVDIAQVMLDPSEDTAAGPSDSWRPRPEPTDIELLSHAFTELGTRPAAALDALRETVQDVSHAAASVGGKVAGMLSAMLAIARSPVPSPLNVPIGEQRRFAAVDLSLVDVKHVRHALGGTINDVLLAVITGALRSWLQARGHPVQQGDVLRAMLPMSIAVPASGSGHAGGNRVSATLVELPVGEADPAVRLQQISYQLAFLDESSHFVGAEAIVGIAGFGPPTLHALGARVGATVSSRLYNLVITNVPGPQRPLYAAGSRMVAAYPVVPLTQQQALSIGVISYDGGIYIGLYADRDALVDIDVLASCLEESLEELLDRCRSALRSLRIVPDEASAADDPRKNAG
ncbi:MAG TPA: wax ester/triacylglycerol synthase family O-acyltransferase [Actinobacteria bacterium]|nr:wax ester/triacylglycerol synthase family O-acyltransferase [Actinomycetota bacterium]